jgi:hypothetical protein
MVFLKVRFLSVVFPEGGSCVCKECGNVTTNMVV